MSKPDLVVDWCSYEAAKYAVMTWHYSKAMPSGKLVKLGVWEGGDFIGCVLLGRGVSRNIGNPYGLTCTEVNELQRIALACHAHNVSEIVSRAIKMVKSQSPGVRLCVSYADPEMDHVGGIYQAMNWVYCGMSNQTGGHEYFVNGRWQHVRSLGALHGTRATAVLDAIYPGAPKKRQSRKHKYLYPLDRAMRRQIAPLAQPYPKRESCEPSIEGDTPSDQDGRAGSTPAVRSSTQPELTEA